MKKFIFVYFSMLYLVMINSRNVFIPTTPDISRVPPFGSNLLKKERLDFENEELGNIENIVQNIVKSNDKELKQQATELMNDKNKLEEFLSIFPKNESVEKNNFVKPDQQSILALLNMQYEDEEILKNKIDLKLKNTNISEAIDLIGKLSKLNFIIDPKVRGTVSSINLENVSVSSALKIILSSNDPPLALIKDLGVWRIRLLEDAIISLRHKIPQIRKESLITNFKRILNTKWSENLKIKIEKMWLGIISNQSNKTGYYLNFDDNTRNIFFRGDKVSIKELSTYLNQIDKKIHQVRIEGRVVIAGKDFENSLGLQASGIYNRSASASQAGLTWIGFGPVKTGGDGDIKDENLRDWALNFLPRAASQFLNLPIIFGNNNLNKKRVNLVLNAAESKSEIETILKPSLLVNSGEVAKLLVGEELPIETKVQERIEGSLRDIDTISYKDIGIKLKIVPTVSPDTESIFMDIFVENSYIKNGVDNTSFDAKKSIIVTTRSKSKVLLKSGQTTLISGLISNTKIKERNGIPYLQNIPLIGLLFKGRRKNKRNDQLMIFITPTVI